MRLGLFYWALVNALVLLGGVRFFSNKSVVGANQQLLSISMSYLCSRPCMFSCENFAFFSLFVSGLMEKLTAELKSHRSRIVRSKMEPSKSQLPNDDCERSLSVKSTSCKVQWSNVVFLIFRPWNEQLFKILRWKLSDSPNVWQVSNKRPTSLQSANVMLLKAVFDNLARLRLHPENVQSVNRNDDKSMFERSQSLKVQFSYSPFANGESMMFRFAIFWSTK
jgi:hypothetical protein